MLGKSGPGELKSRSILAVWPLLKSRCVCGLCVIAAQAILSESELPGQFFHRQRRSHGRWNCLWSDRVGGRGHWCVDFPASGKAGSAISLPTKHKACHVTPSEWIPLFPKF